MQLCEQVQLYLKMHQKLFDGKAPPGASGRAYCGALPDPELDLRGTGAGP